MPLNECDGILQDWRIWFVFATKGFRPGTVVSMEEDFESIERGEGGLAVRLSHPLLDEVIGFLKGDALLLLVPQAEVGGKVSFLGLFFAQAHSDW
jgi:hypothetical protein